MAFRLNTVEYGWETLNTENSGSIPVSGVEKLVYIPETGSRTFLQADLEVYLRDANTGTTISNITTYQLSCSIDDNLAGERAVSSILMTGDHCVLGFKNAFTNLFNQRFTGSTHRIQPRLNFPQALSGVWNGQSFKLIITYQFDDTDVDTMIKTVRLPLDSAYGTLSATAMTVFGQKQAGYFNIPALDTFLPEASKQIRDIWIEYRGVDASAAATSVSMATQIDSGSVQTRFLIRGSLNTDTTYIDFQNISGSIDTSTEHTLKASASLASRLSCVSPLLMCSYEYSSVSSTSILSSCIIPFNCDYYSWNNGTYASTEGFINFLIPERDPSMVHSALIFNPLTNSSTTRTYLINNTRILNNLIVSRGTVAAGTPTIHARFDSKASGSANFNIGSGFNKLKFSTTQTAAATSLGHTGFLLLNYSSSKLVNGIHSHNNTLYFGTGSFLGTLANRTFNIGPTQSFHPSISSSYYLHDPVYIFQDNQSSAFTTPLSQMFNVHSSSVYLVQNLTHPVAEMGLRQIVYGTGAFLKFPNEVTGSSVKLDFFKKTNGFYFDNIGAVNPWHSTYSTFQQNIFRITGSLSNCNSSSLNYEVGIYLSGSNVPTTPIFQLNSSGSGTTKWFTFDWYEDIDKLYAVTHYPERGISNLATASSGVDILTIDYGTTSDGTEKSFTFIG